MATNSWAKVSLSEFAHVTQLGEKITLFTCKIKLVFIHRVFEFTVERNLIVLFLIWSHGKFQSYGLSSN